MSLKYRFDNFTENEGELQKFTFGTKVTSGFSKYYSKTPLFSYDFIDLNITGYHFHQDCFDTNDVHQYFKMVKHLSRNSINDLLNNSDYKKHFHIYSIPKGKLRELVVKISGKHGLKDEQLPSVGQFALYTNQNGYADRTSGEKSPRIFFMVGDHAILYLLFYDPYHEIKG